MKRGEKDPLLRRIVSGVLVAVIPAMLAYVVSIVDGRRREELTYVNDQMEKLHGPLYALTHANDVAWEQCECRLARRQGPLRLRPDATSDERTG